MTVLRAVQLASWVIPALLLVLMTIVMWIRRLNHDVPIFFAYIAYHAGRSWLLLYVYHASETVYFYSYWTLDLISAILGLAVIWEIYDRLLRPYSSLRQLGFLLFRWAGAALIILAAVAATAAQGDEVSSIVVGILALERGVRIVQGGLLLLLFCFASFLGLSWRHYPLGIALGFALFISVELVVVTMRAHFGTPANLAYQLLKPAAYNCAVLVWLIYVWQPAPAPQPSPSAAKFDLAAWNRTLTEFLAR